ncbi:MAG TPA: C2H2-type zinc finger protein [Xanthobacteraceae bacterium]
MFQPQTAAPVRGAITHGECGQTWTGLRRAHCPVCHITFNSDSAAEQHRRGKPGIDRHCVAPADAGLVAVEQPWGVCWQKPGTDYRFGRDDEQEAVA